MDWVNFELGEDIAHIEQDRNWQETKQDARQQISRREECLVYSRELRGAISSFRAIEMLISLISERSSTMKKLNTDVLNHIVEFCYPGQGPLVYASVNRRNIWWKHESPAHPHPFQIYIRKRPLTEEEKKTGTYDIVDTGVDGRDDSLMVHSGQLARNGRRLTMTHKHYAFSKVLDEEATNQDFCKYGVEPLVQNVLNGLSSTLLCYGQTGTGKTYTLMGALDYAASRFAGQDMEIIFYEVHSKKCYDLLNNRRTIHLRSDENNIVHVRGANKVILPNAAYASVMAVLSSAMRLRASEETQRNPISSRSHAVCIVRVNTHRAHVDDAATDEAMAPGNNYSQSGTITFVDLAGSERNYDTFGMTAAKHRESADINYSLMALKNCFRAYHSQLDEIFIQGEAKSSQGKYQVRKVDMHATHKEINVSKAIYRASLLTRILKECFVLPTEEQLRTGQYHRTSIVATVSPSAVDAHHTINTLDHMSLMDPSLERFQAEVSAEVPKEGAALTSTPMALWSSSEVNMWLATVERGRFSYLAVPPQFTGADLLKLDANSISNFFAGQMRQARTGNEGEAWTVEGESHRHLAISRALWRVIRREIEMTKNDFF